jgi:UDP-N-acetylmuramoylalanine--D-glutamate ligase
VTQRALVIGWGVTGQAVVRYLRARGTDVIVAEDRPQPGAASSAAAAGARMIEAPTLSQLADLVADSVFVVPSPGVPVSHPVFRAAADAGVPVYSEIELAWRRLVAPGHQPRRLVAITGTNGKTTVTTLVAAMLTASGRRAVAAGNIGLPLLEAAGLPTDVVVGEVSSFQLQFTEGFRPNVSCWLNLAEDHLDWHPTMSHYAAAKARVWAAQGQRDLAVLNADDPEVMAAADHPVHGIPAGVTRRTFSITGPGDLAVVGAGGFGVGAGAGGAGAGGAGAGGAGLGAGVAVGPGEALAGPGGSTLVEIGRLRRALPHDLANALAAAACALAVGATVEGCREALECFETLPHRVELVGDAGGVRWYDDSKATTPASVRAAVAGFRSVVLIAGGRNKGLDLSALAATVPPVRAVVAIGEAGGDVEKAFKDLVPVVVATSMADAVAAAAAESRPGDAVLLSPGCASFDWYASYAERGVDFTALVTERIDKDGSES